MLVAFFAISMPGIAHPAAVTHKPPRRPITITDAITVRNLVEGPTALYSPDGSRFVVVLKSPDLAHNVNEFSLLFFRSGRALRSAKPDAVIKMASASNRDAIRKIKWLADGDTIAFIGEQPDRASQVYTFNVRTKNLRRITTHLTSVTDYDLSATGGAVLFAADPPNRKPAISREAREQGVVIEGQSLTDLLAGDYDLPAGQNIFLLVNGQATVPIRVPPEYFISEWNPVSLSPSGQYAVIGAQARKIPSSWGGYDGLLHASIYPSLPRAQVSRLNLYLLLDVNSSSLKPLLEAPSLVFGAINWAVDGRSVFVRTFLPLDGTDVLERESRSHQDFDVQVEVPTRLWHKVDEREWPKPERLNPPLQVNLDQTLNSPSKLFVSDPKTQQKNLLLDLNPQLAQVYLGEVEPVEFTIAHGLQVRAGLYLPTDYTPGRRYPLVMQTHGFVPDQFSMDGRSEWSSAFAARPLAANGFVVVQLFRMKDPYQRTHYNDERNFGGTLDQAARNLNMAVYEGAVKYLDERGLIDRDRVGIIGFSRTVSDVAYTLTHSSFHFAAAMLVDGVDGGYFQYIALPLVAGEFNEINGGASPFGEGLPTWIKESPSFSLDRINTPVQLVALQPFSILESWEWYVGLSLQRKPVDLLFFPDASHMISKPRERMAAMKSLLDWFRFWLKDEEDDDPGKAQQYIRWRQLRALAPRTAETKTGE